MTPIVQQLKGVREGAGRHRHVVTGALEQLDERPQDNDVRGVREIHPDAHLSAVR
jgi:hypothetical protein